MEGEERAYELLVKLQSDLVTVSRRLDDWRGQGRDDLATLKAAVAQAEADLKELRRVMRDDFATKEEVKTPHRMVYGFATAIVIGAVSYAMAKMNEFLEAVSRQ